MIHLIVILIVLDLLLWLADQLRMDAVLKTIIPVLAILRAILYCLRAFGMLD